MYLNQVIALNWWMNFNKQQIIWENIGLIFSLNKYWIDFIYFLIEPRLLELIFFRNRCRVNSISCLLQYSKYVFVSLHNHGNYFYWQNNHAKLFSTKTTFWKCEWPWGGGESLSFQTCTRIYAFFHFVIRAKYSFKKN